MFGKDKSLRKEAIIYLLKFAVGLILGLAMSVLVLSSVFESNIYFLCSLFLGLTIAAIPLIIYEERACLKGKYWQLIFTAVGIAAVVLLAASRSGSAITANLDYASLSVLQYVYLFVCGILAISFMLLPGISGSSVLLILGVYVPTISAVNELLHLDFAYLPGLLVFVLGIVFGVIVTSGLIQKGLKKYRSQMVYLIIGLMIGSLYSILMGPTTLDTPQPMLDFGTFSILVFIIGIAVLAGLEWMKRLTPNTEETHPGKHERKS